MRGSNRLDQFAGASDFDTTGWAAFADAEAFFAAGAFFLDTFFFRVVLGFVEEGLAADFFLTALGAAAGFFFDAVFFAAVFLAVVFFATAFFVAGAFFFAPAFFFAAGFFPAVAFLVVEAFETGDFFAAALVFFDTAAFFFAFTFLVEAFVDAGFFFVFDVVDVERFFAVVVFFLAAIEKGGVPEGKV
jgi:hypothetical protein